MKKQLLVARFQAQVGLLWNEGDGTLTMQGEKSSARGGWNMLFPDKLISLRKARNMTQAELAEELNISRQAISKWESGTSVPSIENLISISAFFNITVDFLIKPELDIESIQDQCTTSPQEVLPAPSDQLEEDTHEHDEQSDSKTSRETDSGTETADDSGNKNVRFPIKGIGKKALFLVFALALSVAIGSAAVVYSSGKTITMIANNLSSVAYWDEVEIDSEEYAILSSIDDTCFTVGDNTTVTISVLFDREAPLTVTVGYYTTNSIFPRYITVLSGNGTAELSESFTLSKGNYRFFIYNNSSDPITADSVEVSIH